MGSQSFGIFGIRNSGKQGFNPIPPEGGGGGGLLMPVQTLISSQFQTI